MKSRKAINIAATVDKCVNIHIRFSSPGVRRRLNIMLGSV